MAQPALSFASSLPSAVDRAAPSVVRVVVGSSSTSGFVWDDAGTILTSRRATARCAAGAITVVAEDGEARDAEVVGIDPSLDVAVLRVDPTGLAAIARRDAADVRVGEPVLALGRPGRSVRASLRIVGVVGDEVRTGRGARLERYLETDRGFPHGFAGGPLVDLDGRALGLDSPWVVRGADLTVPIATLVRITDELAAHGAVRRAYLGVGVQPVRLPAALEGELGQTSGALVMSVDDGSPAADAGLLLGDVVVALAEVTVTGPDALRAALADRGGNQVVVRLLRAGELIDRTVTVGQRG
jgi:serine protease DegQ